MSQNHQSLAGRTIRWTFQDGPTAGRTFEHTFFPDGTVMWHDVDPSAEATTALRPAVSSSPEAAGVPYASYEVAPDVHLVSYLSDSGYTVTVTLNLETCQCSGVASNVEEWYPSTGTVEVIR